MADNDKPYLDRVEVYAFSKDGRILGGRFKGDGFMVPGGTVDKGETLKAAAERECLEEAGWSIRVMGSARLPSRYEDYKEPYSAKIKERAKKFRGTHTICMLAACGDEPEMEYVDDVMTDVGLWTLDDAIKACNDKGKAVRGHLETWKERFADDESLSRKELEDEGIRANTKKAASSPEIVIDRPKGFKKTFKTPNGPVDAVYPLDYGYFKGVVNPQDNENADVFVGSGGSLHGRFMKGKTLTGEWQPDEHKWYRSLTPEDHAALMAWWSEQDPTLIRDDVRFDDEAGLLADLAKLQSTKTAASAPDIRRKYTYTPKLEAAFTPDFSPEDLKSVSTPKLDHFLGKDHDVGFRAWYDGYGAGKRTEDDARQIKRWMGVKARWLPVFSREPTARRALALANWGIDPAAHVAPEQKRGLSAMLRALERKERKKTAAEDHPFTLCVDLDGTLAEQMKPFDPKVIGPPRADAVRWMEAFRDAGARIIIWTVRGDASLVKEWLDDHGVPYDYVNENPDHPPDGSRKVLADLYLDDRGVSASGAWNDFGAEVLEKMLADDAPKP